ncbi:MAG TPA: hypothetical protein VEI97_10335, partial [bacterium]|nr:hypothetical protein [bacterium]
MAAPRDEGPYGRLLPEVFRVEPATPRRSYEVSDGAATLAPASTPQRPALLSPPTALTVGQLTTRLKNLLEGCPDLQ